MDVIKLLPDSVANQIAAGEVIQRPASVVKELVENAVDAGATEISVIIKDAGRTLIQVVDNGCGMSPTDARLAFERHSTSKIRQADDLFSLHTMGFRGEALASICAVSQVDLRTMQHGQQCGTRLVINGSRVESQAPEACVPGSNMMVKNLFFNVPARRKFLKKDTVEMSNILHEFERLALVNPQVELTLIHNDVTIHSLRPTSLHGRIVDLFGKSLNQQLIPVETDTDIVKINGFVVRPEHCRKRGALQYLFVNGRNMRHPYFHKSIMQCYEGLIPSDEQPVYFLDFTVDPQTIDVNIHPTKNEIKFEQEQGIRQILYAAVKETIGRYNSAPQIDFANLSDGDYMPDIPVPKVSGELPMSPPVSSYSSHYNPFNQGAVQNWETLYRNFEQDRAQATMSDQKGQQPLPDIEPEEEDAVENDNKASIIYVGNRYVAVAARSGLRLIDLRRAHQTVLYAKFAAQDHSGSGQRLLFPETVTLEPQQMLIYQELEPQLSAMGFDLSQLGHCAVAIHAVPSGADGVNPGEMLCDIVRSAIDAPEESGSFSPQLKAARALAVAASFRPDRRMTEVEVQSLLSDLMSLSTPGFSPLGKPVFTLITPADIAKLL